MSNALNWFEIPAADIKRAKKFYDTVLNAELKEESMDGYQMAIFPHDQTSGVGGALAAGEQCVPSTEGQVVYLNMNGDIDGPLSRVVKAGGKIAMDKTLLSDEIGYIAMIIDSEGNRVGLHSPAK